MQPQEHEKRETHQGRGENDKKNFTAYGQLDRGFLFVMSGVQGRRGLNAHLVFIPSIFLGKQGINEGLFQHFHIDADRDGNDGNADL